MSLRIETQEESNASELVNKFKGEIFMIAHSELSKEEKKEKTLTLLNKFETELSKFLTPKDDKYHKILSEALKYMTANITDKKKIQISKSCEETKAKIDHGLRDNGKPKTTPPRKRSPGIKSSIKKVEKLLYQLNNDPRMGKL